MSIGWNQKTPTLLVDDSPTSSNPIMTMAMTTQQAAEGTAPTLGCELLLRDMLASVVRLLRLVPTPFARLGGDLA